MSQILIIVLEYITYEYLNAAGYLIERTFQNVYDTYFYVCSIISNPVFLDRIFINEIN
jgi:hypothetical protein